MQKTNSKIDRNNKQKNKNNVVKTCNTRYLPYLISRARDTTKEHKKRSGKPKYQVQNHNNKKCNENNRNYLFSQGRKKRHDDTEKMQIPANTIPERKHQKRTKHETGNTPINTKQII